MPTTFSHDVFLSYNHKDKERVRRLAERLRKAELRVWFDEWSVKPGEIISLKVDEGLDHSRVLVLCLSPNALESNWVGLERSTAIHRDPSNEGRRFIPLLLADCDLPDSLRRYKHVDFRKETDEAFAELLTACRIEREEARDVRSTTKKKPPRQGSNRGKLKSTTNRLAVFEREFGTHESWVFSVAISPDGNWAVSGSRDRIIKIWDWKSGECLRELEGHTGDVNAVAITPDSKRIVSGSDDKSVRVWDAKTGGELAKLEGHTSLVRTLVTLADNSHALSAQDTREADGNFKLWDLNSASCLKTIQYGKYAGRAFCCAVNREGTRAISGHFNGQICLWDLENGELLSSLEGHSDIVKSVHISVDGRHAVSGSNDETIKIWDLTSMRCIGTLEGHTDTVESLAISSDGVLIASTGFNDNSVRLWDWKAGVCRKVIERTDEDFTPTCAAFSPDGSRLLVGTYEGALYKCRLKGTAVQSTNSHKYVNAKVVLLGEGTVGKTSLAHRLVDDKYVVADRTHGMNVWQLDLPLTPDASLQREALLWDLAGQEDYRLIHQLFLDETALALLLINPQKDDPFAEAGDWLKALKAASQAEASRDIAKLLIFSQIDVGGMKLGDAKIQRFSEQFGFANWIGTSAKSGENCSDRENGGAASKLKQLISEMIPWENLPWTSTPRLLTELKNAVIAMRDEYDIRLVRFAELTQRLEQALPEEKFDEADVRTAVTLLANHGLARALKFGDLVLLQPELLNGYAGAIIRAARANKDEIGSVLESDIYRLDFDFTGVARLKHRPDEELLLRALVQTFLDHSLCIAEDLSNGRHLVFPSQYRRDKDIPHDPDIFVSYTFSGEWQTVWTTLVVRLWYSQEFEHKELWRNAAEFASPRGFTLGLKIDNKQGEGTATVSLYFDKEVPDELKVIFIEYVHRHLAKFGCEVSRDRRYVCQECGKPVLDLEAVRRKLEAKKDFIYCQQCDEKVPLIDFIEQRLKTDRVARKILAMDETATRALDTQALEQILIGHMMAICGEANQIFRELTKFDYGVDGEVEFKDNDGNASGKKIYVQLKSGNSYLRTRKSDGSEVFDVKNERHLEYWISQPVDVYLVIRQTDEVTGSQTIRWMNISSYLKNRKDRKSKQIVFEGEKLDMEAVWKVRDQFFPKTKTRKS